MLSAGRVMLDMLCGLGWLVPVAVLLPNVLWAVLSGAERPPSPTTPLPPWTRLVEPVELVGRAAVFILPVFYRFKSGTTTSVAGLAVMLIALAFYYLGWGRYFTRGRDPVLLYKSLLGVPLPLAVSPVVFFIAASVVLESAPLAIASVAFGAAHVAIGLAERRRLRSPTS